MNINQKSTVGIFKVNEITGDIPVTKQEYDLFKVYFIEPNIQQCECYNSKDKILKAYRRTMLDSLNFTPWQEVLPWYKG